MNRQRLEYAAEIFLTKMRQQHAKLRPGEPSPVRGLSDYSPEERSALMAAVGSAIRSSRPEFDKGFNDWCEKRRIDA